MFLYVDKDVNYTQQWRSGLKVEGKKIFKISNDQKNGSLFIMTRGTWKQDFQSGSFTSWIYINMYVWCMYVCIHMYVCMHAYVCPPSSGRLVGRAGGDGDVGRPAWGHHGRDGDGGAHDGRRRVLGDGDQEEPALGRPGHILGRLLQSMSTIYMYSCTIFMYSCTVVQLYTGPFF